MDRLTTLQHIKIIKTCYKNSDSATAAYLALRGDYSLHNRRTTQETAVVKNIERPVHYRFARLLKLLLL